MKIHFQLTSIANKRDPEAENTFKIIEINREVAENPIKRVSVINNS